MDVLNILLNLPSYTKVLVSPDYLTICFKEIGRPKWMGWKMERTCLIGPILKDLVEIFFEYY
jgi:hypothetical protein